MAVKDHSLDEKIVKSAKAEFMKFGFQKASLYKIADNAGLTTGALYTRYKNKDDLFCSLVSGVTEKIYSKIMPVQDMYEDVYKNPTAEKMLIAIRKEKEIYLEVLFEYYDECMLLFCKSDGTSIEKKIKELTELKSKQTIDFLKNISQKETDLSVIEFIMSGQFYFYRQILEKGYDKEKTLSCMETVEFFLESGWKALFDRII